VAMPAARRERERDMLCHSSSRELAQVRHAEEATSTRCLDPSDECHPALIGGNADRRARADATPDRAARLSSPVRFEREGNPSGAVPPPTKHPSWAHQQHRTAGPATIASDLDDDALRSARRFERAADLSLHHAVTHDDGLAPERPRGSSAAWARLRPRLGARRHPRHPGLDPERARDESLPAPCLLDSARSTTEGMGPAKSTTPPSPFLSFEPASTPTSTRWPSTQLGGRPGARLGLPSPGCCHHAPDRRARVGAMSLGDQDPASAVRRCLPGAVTATRRRRRRDRCRTSTPSSRRTARSCSA